MKLAIFEFKAIGGASYNAVKTSDNMPVCQIGPVSYIEIRDEIGQTLLDRQRDSLNLQLDLQDHFYQDIEAGKAIMPKLDIK